MTSYGPTCKHWSWRALACWSQAHSRNSSDMFCIREISLTVCLNNVRFKYPQQIYHKLMTFQIPLQIWIGLQLKKLYTQIYSVFYLSKPLFNCFFSQGRYAGNAVGFKISSLLKLIETRANKPRMTLLHYLVEEAEKTDKHVLQFADDLKQPLTAANRCADFHFFHLLMSGFIRCPFGPHFCGISGQYKYYYYGFFCDNLF